VTIFAGDSFHIARIMAGGRWHGCAAVVHPGGRRSAEHQCQKRPQASAIVFVEPA
jgi:hypothetical protein